MLGDICLETVRLACLGTTELDDTCIGVGRGNIYNSEFLSGYFLHLLIAGPTSSSLSLQLSLFHHSISVSSTFTYILHPRSLFIAMGIYVTIFKTPFELWRDWRLHIFSFSFLTGLSQCFGHNRHSKKYVWVDLFFSFKRKYVMVW